MVSTSAKFTLHTLRNSDGSALYVSPNATHTLQSAVHYPLEVPYRSDEIPTDTYIEVSLRPHNGVAMVKERHIEQVVRKALTTVVMGEETPRCMLQVTVQVMGVEVDEQLSGGVKSGGQGEGYLDILAGAVNTSFLACLDAGVQLRGLLGAILVGIDGNGNIFTSPTVRQRKLCSSLHVFGFDSTSQCVLMESEGRFGIEEWEIAEGTARERVCGKGATVNGTNGDIDMDDTARGQSLFEMMRRSVEERVLRDERWKS